MPKVKEDTVTDVKIGNFYNITPQTLYNYKISKNEKMVFRYIALKKFYSKYLKKQLKT